MNGFKYCSRLVSNCFTFFSISPTLLTSSILIFSCEFAFVSSFTSSSRNLLSKKRENSLKEGVVHEQKMKNTLSTQVGTEIQIVFYSSV